MNKQELPPGVKVALAALLTGEESPVDVLRLGPPWTTFILRLEAIPRWDRFPLIKEVCEEQNIDPIDIHDLELVLTASPPSSVTDTPLWPELENAAKHGPAWEAVMAALPETEADPVALFLCLLVMIGNMVDRKAYIFGGDEQYTNNFLLLIGKSSEGRKGTAFGVAKRITSLIDPEWTRTRITTGIGSGEALIDLIRDEQEEVIVVKDPQTGADVMEDGKKKRVVATRDAGVEDKRLLWYSSEFARILTQIERPGNTSQQIIIEAWDSKPLENRIRSKPAFVINPHVSIITCITPVELQAKMKNVDLENGFANRFLLCLSRRSKVLPEGGNPVNVPEPVLTKIRKALRSIENIPKLSFRRNEEAKKIWAEYYNRASQDRPGLYGTLVARAVQHQLRFQVIFALLDNTQGTILPEHVEAAHSLWRYCAASTRYIFGGTYGDKTADLIYSSMIQLYPAGLSLSDIQKTIFNNHGNAEDIRRALLMLQGQGLMKSVYSRVLGTGGKGRRKESWVPLRSPFLEKDF